MSDKQLEKMKQLIEQIELHNRNYYELDNPTISDKEYDRLYDTLVNLEKETGVVLPYSPTLRVGGEILDGFKKYQHRFRLYSLDKCQTREDLVKWINSVQKVLPSANFTCEYKFDGLSLVCYYNNGVLVSAGTRGNGFIGEDVTEQARTIKTVPLKIKFKGELIVQGEGMITLSNLKKFNEKSDDKLKNARNAAAGAIRNLDSKETAKRNLDWFSYTIHYAEGQNFKTQEEMMLFLKDNGFNVGDYFKICKNADEVLKQIDYIEKIRDKIDILIDGVVVRLNNVPERELFGFTAKFPKWAMAFKFEAMEVSSKLLNVVWQVGRTGKITPIAEIEPVELAGATIKRATLNNAGDIEKKQVEIGSRVFIRRSNEVIPEILGLAEKLSGSTKIQIPKVCPSCGEKLEQVGANLFCLNKSGCREQIVDKLEYFASRDCMNIEGLSFNTIEALHDIIGVSKFSHLYELTGNELGVIGNAKDKKISNLMNAIQNSKKVQFANFLNALSISGVGTKTSKVLAKEFSSLEDLENANLESLCAISDVGDVIAKSIYDYFHNSENLNEINRLISDGVQIIYDNKQVNTDSEFFGKKIVITGTFEKYSRAQLTEIFESFGAQVSSSISKNTDFLLCGENSGSKLDKAIAFGVSLIYEKELNSILEKGVN